MKKKQRTERRGNICDKRNNTSGNEKVIDPWVQSNHGISDDSEEKRYRDEDRCFCECLT